MYYQVVATLTHHLISESTKPAPRQTPTPRGPIHLLVLRYVQLVGKGRCESVTIAYLEAGISWKYATAPLRLVHESRFISVYSSAQKDE